MAQVTTLAPTATPGKPWSFPAKAAVGASEQIVLLRTVPAGLPGLRRVAIRFQADTDGKVLWDLGHALRGVIERVVTVPAAGTAPSADWDLELYDPWNNDLLNGKLADRHTSNVEWAYPYHESPIATAHEDVQVDVRTCLRITNAGSGSQATVVFYVRDLPPAIGRTEGAG